MLSPAIIFRFSVEKVGSLVLAAEELRWLVKRGRKSGWVSRSRLEESETEFFSNLSQVSWAGNFLAM